MMRVRMIPLARSGASRTSARNRASVTVIRSEATTNTAEAMNELMPLPLNKEMKFAPSLKARTWK
jgi:hypothetical protein